MTGRHQRMMGVGLVVLVLIWMGAWGGYRLAQSSRLTAAKVYEWAEGVGFGRMEGEARKRALEALVRKINALPLEERRRLRLGRAWEGWFERMTEEEKGWFIEETMPTGFRQMLASFEELPEARRRQAVEDAVKRLREAQQVLEGETEDTMREEGEEVGTNAPVELSPELRERAARAGLKAYYMESSAQAKAELAPLLEEIQRSMESGRLMRRGRGHE